MNILPHLSRAMKNAAFLFTALVCSSAAIAQVPLNLINGWNLLGNSSALPIDVATLFGDPVKFTTVWKWNRSASRWAFYAPSMTPSALTSYAQSKGYDVLVSIDAKEGFWVNASTSVALNGPTASRMTLVESDLQQAWNLAASDDNKTPSALNLTLGSSLNAAGKAIVTAWAWDASAANWRFYAPALEAQGGTVLSNYIVSKNYLPFTSAIAASEGFWLNIGVASVTTSSSTTSTTTTSTTTAAPTTTTTTAVATTTTTTARVTATNFTAAAMAGELLDYSLDTANLTYSYTVTKSQYGLSSTPRTGTLRNNGDGTYTPSGVNNGLVVTLPNGLMLTTIRESINSTLKDIPVMGMSSPVTTLSNMTFNFIQRACVNIGFSFYSCDSAYGTFRTTASGAWYSCAAGNLAAGACTTGYYYYGTLKSLGGGKWQVLDSTNTTIGTAIVLLSGAQQVVFLDLEDARVGGFGIGLLIGSTQETGTTTQANGTWASSSSNGDSYQFAVSGTQYTCQYRNGVYCGTNTYPLYFNSPWTGFVTNSFGGTGLLAGTGMYAYQESGGYVEIGIKIR